MPFSKRTDWNPDSNPLSAAADQLRASGVSLLDLTVSNPTACGFRYLDSGLLGAFSNSENLVYHPDPHGLLQARQAVCDYYAQKGVPVSPEQIFLTASTSEAYSFLFRLLTEPGDKILGPQPGYPLMDYLAALHDLCLERYPLVYKNGWRMDLQGLYPDMEEVPRAIVLVNPGNPAGNYVLAEQMAELSILCKMRDIPIISDEVFFDYALDDSLKPFSLAGTGASTILTFTLSGVSKILGLPQMKLSWIVVSGPGPLQKEAIRRLEIISDTFLSAGTPAQNALKTWLLHGPKIREEILARLKINLRFLTDKLSPIGGVRILKAEGGWYGLLQLPTDRQDEEWAMELLKKDHVLTHPGYLFDFSEGSYLAVSLLVPEKVFAEGVGRMAQTLRAGLRA